MVYRLYNLIYLNMQSKANRTNSFRLHRISKASSVKKHSQTFYQADQSFKLASINSVSRGVKYNDLTFVTGQDLNKLRKEPLDNDDGFYEAAHVNLTDVRKRYDDMKKQRVQKDQNIAKLKEEINKYKIFEGQFSGKINSGKEEVNKLMEDLQNKKKVLEESMMEKKVLLSMQARLKSDKVVYDQRKFDKEKQFRFQRKQLEILKEESHQIGQDSDRTNKVYMRLINQLKSEQFERQQHMSNLQSMIETKQNCIQTNAKRQEQIRQIAQRALQDKNFDEKQWQNIYLTHTFVNKMLRNKIQREMDKFHVVQFAFKEIKTATGINDAKTLVYKYLNKETVYGDLLGRITANEQKITHLKDQTQRLLEEQKQLEMEKQTIQNIKVKEVDISENLKSLAIIEERKKGVETIKNEMSHWLIKQFKKFNHIEKFNYRASHPKTPEELKQAFQKYIQFLLKSLTKCDEESKDEKTQAGDLSMRDSARVTRVIPKRSRKNSAGQQIFDVEEQQKNPQIQVQQLELVNLQREQLLRNNERFMKEAKKRQEEKRKLLVEKNAEKKEKKAPEVKKEEDD